MWINLLLGFLALLAYFYYKTTRRYNYFKDAGVKAQTPMFPFGSDSCWKSFTGRAHFIDPPLLTSRAFPNEKVLGYYSIGDPVVVINDLELVKTVLIKDFEYFQDRRPFVVGKTGKVNEAAGRMMLVLEGNDWKVIRAKMSPVFTSGKLKGMTGMINQVAHNFVEHLGMLADKGQEFDAKKTTGLFTLDTIATCGFGVESNSFKNPDADLTKMAQKMLSPSYLKFLEITLIMLFPKIGEKLNLNFFDKVSMGYFYDVISATISQRRNLIGSRRNDFVDHILDALKDKALEKDEDMEKQFEKDAKVTTDKKLNLSEVELERDMAANTLLFFFAGLDTSSTVMALALVILARKEDAQEQLYQEIKDAVEDSKDGVVDYKTAQELPLLDAAIHETLRYYPLGLIERKCNKPYKVEGTNLVIEKDMIVQVPTVRFHKDPSLFPYPEEFNFENFSAEAKAKRGPYGFMGFGLGPRNCIGMRFALLQIKYAMIQLMYNFKIVPSEKTPVELKVNPTDPSGLPVGGTFVKVERRD